MNGISSSDMGASIRDVVAVDFEGCELLPGYGDSWESLLTVASECIGTLKLFGLMQNLEHPNSFPNQSPDSDSCSLRF